MAGKGLRLSLAEQILAGIFLMGVGASCVYGRNQVNRFVAAVEKIAAALDRLHVEVR